MSDNLRYAATACSFLLCAFLFFKTTKKSLFDSSKEYKKKKKTLEICSILLFFLGVVSLTLTIIPDKLNWSKENDKYYTAWINKNNKISFAKSYKDLLIEADAFFGLQKERLLDDGFTVDIITLNQKDTIKVNKYIKSLNKQTELSGCFVLFSVEKNNLYIEQNIYLFNIHDMNIEYCEYYLKARRISNM